MSFTNTNSQLKIKCMTWKKYTEDLFDFETKDVEEKEFSLVNSGKLSFLYSESEKLFHSEDLYYIKKNILDENKGKIVCQLNSLENGDFEITNAYKANKLKDINRKSLERLWFVLKPEKETLLEEGDIIKLGRVRLKLNKIVLKNQSIDEKEINFRNSMHSLEIIPNSSFVNSININKYNKNNLNHFALENTLLNKNLGRNKETLSMLGNHTKTRNKSSDKKLTGFNNISKFCPRKVSEDNISFLEHAPGNPREKTMSPDREKKEIFCCKICFRAESDYQDPLLTPCNCIGSMGYIHYQCLKQCIKTRLNKKESENYTCYVWKNYECEICLKEYPKFIKYKNTIYNLIDYSVPYAEYLVMDYTLYDDMKKKVLRKGKIIISIKEDQMISVGRSQHNQIKLKDISVSRTHCLICKKENKIYIIDKGSKFGTLAYLNRPFIVSLGENATKDAKSKSRNKNKNNELNEFGSKFAAENLRNNSSVFQPTCLSKNLNPEQTYFRGEINDFSFRQEGLLIKDLSGIEVNLVAGKNFLNFRIEKTWNLFGGLFSKALCCKYKNTTDDEFIIDLENDFGENLKERANTKNLKENNLLMTENNSNYYNNFNLNSNANNNPVFNSVNNVNLNNNIQDSYLDFYLNIDTIIRQTDNNMDQENQGDFDSRSFL